MFEWKEEYSVGIKEIDKQHRKLLGIGEELYYVLENTSQGIDQYDNIRALLKELYDYTVYHFGAEEELMEEHDYIGLGSHRFQHKFFIKKLEEIDLEELDLNQEGAVMDLLDFVADWITKHILEVDQEYIPVLKGN